MTGLTPTLLAAVAIGGVSTLGDFIWATWIPQHMAIYGVAHGTLLFLVVGLFLGTVAGQRAAGALAGAGIGFVAGGAFYLISPIIGFTAMFLVWVAAWLALAALHGRLNADPTNLRAVAGRGAIAAVASGLGFYLISGIWRPFNPQGWDYALHFGAWTFAYLPGFGALFLARR